jgi:membrane-bound lytic murein transglycosylase D
VPIILAMTIMGKNAKEYGLDNITSDSPVEYETVEMSAGASLALVGDLTDTPVSYLVELNPALLKNVAPSGYSLRVPKSSATALIAGLDNIPPDHRLAWRMHRVETGETLAAIAKRYGVTTTGIISANHMLATDQPEPGDHLIIPAAAPAAPPRVVVRKAAQVRPRATTSGVRRSSVSTSRPAATSHQVAHPVSRTAATASQTGRERKS